MGNIYPGSHISDKTAFRVSVSAEEKLGKLMLDNILSGPGITDRFPFGKQIRQWQWSPNDFRAIGLTEYDYKVIIIANPDINAFAIPGDPCWSHIPDWRWVILLKNGRRAGHTKWLT